jgi:hypothetical protein
MIEGTKQPRPAYVIQSLAMALRRVYDHMHYRAGDADKNFLDEHALSVLQKFTPQFAPKVFKPFTMVVSTLDGDKFICWYSPEVENAMVQAQANYQIRPATAEEKENFS